MLYIATALRPCFIAGQSCGVVNNTLRLPCDAQIFDVADRSVILEKIVQFQNQKSWKMNLLGLKMKHVFFLICNILTSDTEFNPHHFNIIQVTGC